MRGSRVLMYSVLAMVSGWLGAEETFIDVSGPRDAAVMPLAVRETGMLNGIQLTRYTHHELTVPVVNESEKALEIKQILSMCPCVTIRGVTAPVTIPAGGTLAIPVRIDGRKLSPGDFTRSFVLGIAEELFGAVILRGTVTDDVAFTPAKAINLGKSNGLVPWTRTIGIQTKHPKNLKLTMRPEEPSLPFTGTLKQVTEQTYELTIVPKLPLPPKRYRAAFELETSEVAGYGPIEVGIYVDVVPPVQLAVPSRGMFVSANALEKGETVTAVIPIRDASSLKAQRALRLSNRVHSDGKRSPSARSVAEDFLSEKEEAGTWKSSEIKTWEHLATTVTVEAPAGVTGKVSAEKAGELNASVQVTPEAFKGKRRLHVTFRQHGRQIGRIVLMPR